MAPQLTKREFNPGGHIEEILIADKCAKDTAEP